MDRYERELAQLRDGRVLEFCRNEVRDRPTVIFHQGTLTDMTGWNSWLAHFAERGDGAIAFNRSGYGRSSHREGRVTRDVGDDVAQLCDQLGVETFVSVGWSGGGSHALATGLDPRCRGVVTLAGIAPFAQPDLDFYDGLKADDIAEYHAALRSVDELIALMRRPGHGETWCAPDAAALASGSMAELREAIATCTEYGLECLRDDYSAYLSPWGFAVEDVQVPVVIFQGDLDENVPVGHARWLARHLPHAQLRLYEGEGHVSLVSEHRADIESAVVALLEHA
jgi:pimeloyl-ACP methyl ester carboxylesterase